MRNRPIGDIGRRRFVSGSALALLGAAGTTLAPLDALAFGSDEHEDAPNQHNMLVVGEQAVFLSHLPMFQAGKPSAPAVDKTGNEFTSPHRFQVILEATFARNGKDVADVYARDRRAHPKTRIYTLEPKQSEPFVLSRLFTPAARPELPSFTGTVFRGHLEQGGEPIAGLDSSLVTITRVVHARKMTPRQARPAHLEYILFGKGSELFLAHAIYAPPDFDQVCSIKTTGHALSAADLNGARRVTFPERTNAVANRLREGQKVSGMLTRPGDTTSSATPIEVQPIVEYYFEEGELLVPHTFDPTPEESKKG